MDKKRGIIIATVLFLLLGTSTFVFANPDQDEIKGTGTMDDGSIQEKDKNINDESNYEVTNIPDITTNENIETDSNTQINRTQTQPVNNNGNINNYNQNNYNPNNGANNPNSGVNNPNNINNNLAVKNLVDSLYNLVINATNKKEITIAREFRDSNQIIEKVNNLTDQLLKQELLVRLSELSKILDDKTPPVISGVENNVTYLEAVKIQVLNETEDVTVYLTKDNNNVKYVLGTELKENGNYTIYVEDIAKNKSETISFTIKISDKDAFVFEDLAFFNNNHISVKNTEYSWMRITSIYETTELLKEYTVTYSTIYKIELYDKDKKLIKTVNMIYNRNKSNKTKMLEQMTMR